MLFRTLILAKTSGHRARKLPLGYILASSRLSVNTRAVFLLLFLASLLSAGALEPCRLPPGGVTKYSRVEVYTSPLARASGGQFRVAAPGSVLEVSFFDVAGEEEKKEKRKAPRFLTYKPTPPRSISTAATSPVRLPLWWPRFLSLRVHMACDSQRQRQPGVVPLSIMNQPAAAQSSAGRGGIESRIVTPSAMDETIRTREGCDTNCAPSSIRAYGPHTGRR